jgi:hypothetical protein
MSKFEPLHQLAKKSVGEFLGFYNLAALGTAETLGAGADLLAMLDHAHAYDFAWRTVQSDPSHVVRIEAQDEFLDAKKRFNASAALLQSKLPAITAAE